MTNDTRRRSKTQPLKVFVLGVLFILLSVVAVFFYSLPEPGAEDPPGHPRLASPAEGHGAAPQDAPNGTALEPSAVVVTLYGQSAADPSKLIPMQVSLPKARSLKHAVSEIVQALQRPFPDPKVLPPLPSGTRVLAVFQDRRDLYVDLSREFVQHHPGGTLESLVTLYALVNSLTRLSSIERVRLLVGGQDALDFKGHLDLRPFYGFNAKIVVGEDVPNGESAMPTETSPDE